MKTSLLVAFCLLIVTACSPLPPKAQPQTLPPGVGTSLLASLSSRNIPQIESASMPQTLVELRDLAAQRRIDLASQAGWLHIQTRNAQTHPDPLSPFAAGLTRFPECH